jgi:hypothetical protein
VLLDMARSQYLARIGFTEGVGASYTDAPRYNNTDDPCYTDGLRTVLFLSDQPRSYQHIELLNWSLPPQQMNIQGQ